MPTPTTFKELVNQFIGIINIIIPAAILIAFVFLMWKIFDVWVINVADEKKREEGKRLVMVTVLVVVLILVIWGVIALLRASLLGY